MLSTNLASSDENKNTQEVGLTSTGICFWEKLVVGDDFFLDRNQEDKWKVVKFSWQIWMVYLAQFGDFQSSIPRPLSSSHLSCFPIS